VKLKNARDLENLKNSLVRQKDSGVTEIIISADATCCILKGSKPVAQAFRDEIRKAGLESTVSLCLAGCLGFCEIEPMVIIKSQDVLYQKVTPQDVPEIISETLKNGKIIERLLYKDPQSGERKKNRKEMSFYQKQNRLILGANEEIEPVSIDDYIAIGG